MVVNLKTTLNPPPLEQQVGYHNETELSIFNDSYERSLINIVPDEIRAAMLRLKASKEDLFLRTESQLKAHCRPDALMNRMRLSFWDEYGRAQDRRARMIMSQVVKVNCSKEYFYTKFLPDDKCVAWMIAPPQDLFLIQREMLELGLDAQREILLMPVKQHRKILKIGKSGKAHEVEQEFIDHKLIDTQMKIIDSLKLRVWGSVTQKFQHANLNVNMNAPKDSLPADISMDELLKLEGSLQRIQGSVEVDHTEETSDVIDVGSTESSESESQPEEGRDQSEETSDSEGPATPLR